MALDSKQKIQYAVLGGILAAGTIYVFFAFMLMPMVNSMQSASKSILELDGKIEKVRTTVRARESTQRELDETRKVILAANAAIPLPKLGNYLLDMQNTLFAQAEGLDMKVTGIADHDQAAVGPDGCPFRLYNVRVNALCGYMTLREYVRRIESHNPYVSVSLIAVAPRADDVEKHEVSVVVSWVIWNNPDERPEFVKNPGPEPRAADGPGQVPAGKP